MAGDQVSRVAMLSDARLAELGLGADPGASQHARPLDGDELCMAGCQRRSHRIRDDLVTHGGAPE